MRIHSGDPLHTRIIASWRARASRSKGPRALATRVGSLVIAVAILRTPALGAQLPPFTAVSAGGWHTCAMEASGSLWCWGMNDMGQVGGSGPDRCNLLLEGFHDVPCAKQARRVPGDQQWKAVSAGGEHTCALTGDGGVWCWGSAHNGAIGAPARGECKAAPGAPSQDCVSLPTRVTTESSFVAIASGYVHTCALTASGAVYCWGRSGWGVLGEAETTSEDLLPPTRVAGVPPFTAIVASAFFTAALDSSGQAWAWGAIDYAAMFDGGRYTPNRTPQPVAPGVSFRSLAAGARSICGITREGATLCWGVLPSRADDAPELRQPPAVHTPVPVGTWGGQRPTEAQRDAWRFRDVVLGWRQGCGLDAGGQAWCWGAYGAQGFGLSGAFVVTPIVIEPTLVPTPIGGTQRFTALSAGMAHVCGLSAEGVVSCWGVGLSGQLGNGRDKSSAAPAPLKSSSK